MAPHFGHLTFVSFVYVAHPKEKTAKTANTNKILIHFLITIHLLSSIDKGLLGLIETVLKGHDRDMKGNLPKNLSFCQGKNIAYPFPLKILSLQAEESFQRKLFLLGGSFLGLLLCFGMFRSARHIFPPPSPYYT